GLVPVEAMACGTPVIAYGRGGATETVLPIPETGSLPAGADPTGVWFDEQTVESLAAAIRVFESQAREFNPHAARRQALTFSLPRFEEAFFSYVAGIMESNGSAHQGDVGHIPARGEDNSAYEETLAASTP